MSARRKRVIEIQFNHKPAKMLLTEKRRVSQNGQTPSIIGICSYCVLNRPVFERCQTLLHSELTRWWSFLLADGAHHKKPHSPTHPLELSEWATACFKHWTAFVVKMVKSVYKWTRKSETDECIARHHLDINKKKLIPMFIYFKVRLSLLLMYYQ